MVWNSFRISTSEWEMEPKQLKSGVYAASMLLLQKETCAAVRILNVSDTPYKAKEDTFIGNAKPAMALQPAPSLERESDRPSCAMQRVGCSPEFGRKLDRPPWSTRSANATQRQAQAAGGASRSSVVDCLQPGVVSLPSDLSPI